MSAVRARHGRESLATKIGQTWASCTTRKRKKENLQDSSKNFSANLYIILYEAQLDFIKLFLLITFYKTNVELHFFQFLKIGRIPDAMV